MRKQRGATAAAAPWLTLGGTVALLVGLGWDVALHHLDPALVAREGILTLANPGHALVAAGLSLTVAGSVLFFSGRLAAWDGRSARQRLVLRLGLTSFLALVVASVGLTAWGGVRLGVDHVHADQVVAAETCTATELAHGGNGSDMTPYRHTATPTDAMTHHGVTAAPDTTDAPHVCTPAAHDHRRRAAVPALGAACRRSVTACHGDGVTALPASSAWASGAPHKEAAHGRLED